MSGEEPRNPAELVVCCPAFPHTGNGIHQGQQLLMLLEAGIPERRAAINRGMAEYAVELGAQRDSITVEWEFLKAFAGPSPEGDRWGVKWWAWFPRPEPGPHPSPIIIPTTYTEDRL